MLKEISKNEIKGVMPKGEDHNAAQFPMYEKEIFLERKFQQIKAYANVIQDRAQVPY